MSRGRQYRTNRARVLAASRICHICGHGQADATDHITPVIAGGPDSIDNLAPTHHTACPTCGKYCNLAKGDKAWATVIRRSASLQHGTGA